ncbi:hypothetical protein BGX38DRAFT_1313991, partial [Terfezia claveryi]
KFQCFVSTSTNPFINLATEQHIFQRQEAGEYEHPVILMLYVNSPCVVIGRNQNPWTEVNLPIYYLHGHRQTLHGVGVLQMKYPSCEDAAGVARFFMI